MENQLLHLITESGVEQATATTLQNSFMPFFNQANEWSEKAKALTVTDVSQVREMKMAREARLALREIRINADKTRKALKEDSLRYGKAVQGVYNVIEYLIVPIENHLQQQEKFAEVQEAKLKAELKEKRENELTPYAEFVPFGIDLSTTSEEDYQKLLTGAKLQKQAKIDAEFKAEQERIAREKAEAEERERIRIENEKLRAEAAKREKELAEQKAKAEAERKAIEEKARKEREEAEAKLAAEREAARLAAQKAEAERFRLEKEIKAKAEAEEKARKEAEAKVAAEQKAKELAERKAKAAPDKIKLKEFAALLDGLELPDVKSEEASKILADSKGLLIKVSNYLKEKAEQL
jgi:hypothetical protein